MQVRWLQTKEQHLLVRMKAKGLPLPELQEHMVELQAVQAQLQALQRAFEVV